MLQVVLEKQRSNRGPFLLVGLLRSNEEVVDVLCVLQQTLQLLHFILQGAGEEHLILQRDTALCQFVLSLYELMVDL